jgi:hypothetical protein
VVFPSRVEGVFHVKSRVSCGLIPLLVVVYSPLFVTSPGLSASLVARIALETFCFGRS